MINIGHEEKYFAMIQVNIRKIQIKTSTKGWIIVAYQWNFNTSNIRKNEFFLCLT